MVLSFLVTITIKYSHVYNGLHDATNNNNNNSNNATSHDDECSR